MQRRLFQRREAAIVLVDHDRVEPHNLLRQNFYGEDVGRFKSQALADRLARAYRRPVGYSVYAFREEDSGSDGGRYPGLPAYGNSLLIGCADNAEGRLRIPAKVVREVFAMVRGSRELASRQATNRLTALERDTLTLFASGRSYTEIAEARGNSVVTVRNTLYRIQDKLSIRKKQELVIWAVRNGLVDDIVVGAEAQPAPEEGQ